MRSSAAEPRRPPPRRRTRRPRRAAQNQPMRITKEQVVGALKLMGLEFQDAEIDMMLRGVNQALSNYESLRKADVPIDTEPAFAFHPGLPGPAADQRAAALRHHDSEDARR